MSRTNNSSTSPSQTPKNAPTSLLSYIPATIINKLTSTTTTNNNKNDNEIAPLFIAPRSYDEDDEDEIEDFMELACGQDNKPSSAGLKSLPSSSSKTFCSKLSSFRVQYVMQALGVDKQDVGCRSDSALRAAGKVT